MVVADQRMLGLMIRGGNEFGLGIYITGVDSGSVAENAGLKVSSCYLRLSSSIKLSYSGTFMSINFVSDSFMGNI